MSTNVILKTNFPNNFNSLTYTCTVSGYLSAFIYICISIIDLSSIYQYIFLSIHLSVYLSIYVYNYKYTYQYIYLTTYLSIYLSIYLPTFIHNQQNSEPQTAHVIWLQEPSSILTMRTLHLGHTFTSSPPPFTPLSSLPDLDRWI